MLPRDNNRTKPHVFLYPSQALFAICFCLMACVPAAAQSIFTVAGGGIIGQRPGELVSLDEPRGVTLDEAGHLYIADTANNLIRRLDLDTGVVSTFAGVGTFGDSGDGGPATAAELDLPQDLNIDPEGNLVFLQRHSVRKIDLTSGTISTLLRVSESGLPPAVGLAVGHNGDLFLAIHTQVVRVDATSGDLETVAGFMQTNPIECSGDGESATAAHICPTDVEIDPEGNIFIANSPANRIHRVDATDGTITTIAGGGESTSSGDGVPATLASLNIPYPTSLTLDDSGNLLFSEWGAVRRIGPDGRITTVAGQGYAHYGGDWGPATAAGLNHPVQVALDSSGNFYIADSENHRVRKVDSSGIISTLSGTGADQSFFGDGGPATTALLSDGLSVLRASAVDVDSSGNIYIADAARTQGGGGNNRIRRIDAETGLITTVAGNGDAGISGDGGPATEAELRPIGVAVDPFGNIFIADEQHSRIRRVDAETGVIDRIAGNGTSGFSGDGGPATEAGIGAPSGMDVDEGGNLYFADLEHHRIRRIDAGTYVITTVAGNGTAEFGGDGGPATEASLAHPSDVAVDRLGNLYVVSSYSRRVRKISAEKGIIRTVAGNGTNLMPPNNGFQQPYGIDVDGNGNLYIADHGLKEVYKANPGTNVFALIAGDRFGSDRLGDGGPATSAGLTFPSGVAVTADGDLYIPDDNRIRAVFACREVTSPILSSPADGSTGLATSVELAWAPVEGAFRYDVLLDTVNPPQRFVESDLTSASISPANLSPLTTFYWQVMAKGDPYCEPFRSAVSAVRSFTTRSECEIPTLDVTNE